MSALTDRIAAVLKDATGVRWYFSNGATPEHVAERIAAELQLTEETATIPVNEPTGELDDRFVVPVPKYTPFRFVPHRRWVSAWSEVQP